ncbi:reverse transcriptase [Gossypium australe]|uniref:Reverse transcriptase n=1 Tax=Gossypium australe TaxID=47621 RepID=A0A5B6WHU3_9ROSI|nr:reverse transcriptase [Gossypium australe]
MVFQFCFSKGIGTLLVEMSLTIVWDFGDFNRIDIVLIPKVPNPTQLVNFRPISLCTVIYKVVAKAIANRLQKIIDKCIDKVQSAFVPGRLITDNVLLAYEILHSINQKRSGKKGVMAVKLDMSKAYDRVEWKFLEEVMIKIGFACECAELLKRCVSTISYKANINGRRGNLFLPSRGFRQGDPLSPFLFLICSEGLSSLMRTAKRRDLLKGAKASRQGPAISHLLFADDCILFGEASNKGANILKDILQDYEICSGQCVNFSKSTVFFSPNTSEENKAAVSNLLGVRMATNPEKYLGIPNMVGRKKRESFQNLLDRISMRIEGWSNKMLSQGGKEVFIKSVLQAIPIFAMSCFLLPNSLCKKMESIFAKFWWQKGKGRKGIHWCQWGHLCRPKSEGGLGFRNMAQFNIALLAKCSRQNIFQKAIFLIRNWVIEIHMFSEVYRLQRVIWKKRLIWKVGTGTSISIGSNDNKVAELNNCQTREWNREVVEYTFGADEADKILRIPLAKYPHDDLLAWRGEPMEVFSVKSSYPNAYAIQLSYFDFYKKMWCIDLPTKLKVNMWKASWNYLPTRVNLLHKKLLIEASCPRCGLETETLNHLFRECPVSVEMWSYLSEVKLTQDTNADFKQWLTSSSALLSFDLCRLFCGALWAIWGDRNARVHEKTSKTGNEVAGFVRNYIQELDGVKTIVVKFPKAVSRWKYPPYQFVKINFDGAYDMKEQFSASGIVARDSEGEVLASKSKIHTNVVSAFAAEALACREAVQLGIDMKQRRMIIERDSLTIIKKCRNDSTDRSQIGSYIYDIRQMKKYFSKIRFDFIPRSVNTLAHMLAKETLKRKEEFYLVGVVPSFAETHKQNERLRELD